MDRRDRAQALGLGFTFDESRMTGMIYDENGDDIVIPVEFQVCPICEGKGKHVNPSIDSHGISSEEFDDDPGFRESYFSGDYDVPCYLCHGARVSPVFAPVTDAEKAAVKGWEDCQDQEIRDWNNEQRYGY